MGALFHLLVGGGWGRVVGRGVTQLLLGTAKARARGSRGSKHGEKV